MTLARLAESLPDSAPNFGVQAPALAVAGAARRTPFRIDGERGAATGDMVEGTASVTLAGRLAAKGPVFEGLKGVNVVASPGLLRRELIGASGTVVETSMVTPALPLYVIRWEGSLPDGGAVRLELLPDEDDIEHRLDGPIVMARARGDEDFLVAAGIVGVEDAFSIEVAPKGLRATHEARHHGVVTLVIAAGPTARVRSALAATAHLATHAKRSSDPSVRLRVRSGVAELDDAMAWAAVRLRNSLSCLRDSRSSFSGMDLLWAGLGALACGDAEAASWAVERLAQTENSPGVAALLAARLAYATGDTRAAVEQALVLTGISPLSSDEDPGLRDLAAAELLGALRHAGSPELADALSGAQVAASGRRLPMAGDPVAGWSPFLRWTGGGPFAAPPPEGPPALREALSAWAEWHEDPDTAWTRWRGILSSGLTAGPSGPGSWDAADPASATGAVVTGLVHGLLGFSPDAPSGRLRLAPRFPGHLRSFGVEGLRVGDASVMLLHARDGGRHSYTLAPQRARVPPMLVFEPRIGGSSLTGATVDGAPAELDVRTQSSGLAVSVQLPLDGERQVTLESE